MNESVDRAALRDRFARACAAIGAERGVDAGFDRLREAYGEPHRRYHTLAHVEACLAWLDWCWSLAERPHEIVLAIFFHDAVYDPRAHGGENEARSAALAEAVLSGAGGEPGAIARVAAMVRATAGHDAGGDDVDTALLVDIDLAILGASPRAYARFEADVRAEYAAFDDATYAAGRAQVLTALRMRAPLYVTPVLAEQLTARARRNLDAAIAEHAARAAAA